MLLPAGSPFIAYLAEPSLDTVLKLKSVLLFIPVKELSDESSKAVLLIFT